jgi:hypothetical protein
MSNGNALDLSSIDPPIWRVMVDGAVYGPYTLGQMKSFAGEGRLTATSQVAAGDGGAFMAARTHAELHDCFQASRQGTAPQAAPETANYLVTLQTDGDGRRAAIAALNTIGRFAELMPGSFILSTDASVVELRSQLSTVLAERGRFIIVNATTGQLAWMGLSDDANTHAKLLWNRGD